MNPRTLHTQPKRKAIIDHARRLLGQGKLREATEHVQPLAKGSKPDPEALFIMGIAAERQFNVGAALQLGKQSLAIYDHPDTRMLIARAHRIAGNTDDAVDCCDTIIEKNPMLIAAYAIKAAALEEAGRFADAERLLEPLLNRTDLGPRERFMLESEWVKVLVQTKRFDEGVELIDRLFESDFMSDGVRVPLAHLKAKALDRSKHYEQAADAAAVANELSKVPFDPDLYTEQVDVLVGNWSRENIATFPKSTCDSEVPVFVAGMPRSGTSLIDQIIDAHPKASGVGELNTVERFAQRLSQAYDPEKPAGKQFGSLDSFRWTRAANDYVKEITALAPPGTERIVNKALGNNKLVGLLARLFPRTRVIHAIRDPRDVAISCFMGGFNNRIHAWTTQIDWVAHSWALSVRMMDHWKQTLDVPILDVHYENLVANPEHEFPRIIEFLGLEWDERCFEFHKSRRTVRTLSYDQVNRPLYKSSSGRHKNYATLIEGVEFPAYEPRTGP